MLESYNQKFKGVVHFRHLETDDYDKGLFSLLGNLSNAPQPPREAFIAHFKKRKQAQKTIVCQCLKTGRLVAAGSILICPTVKGFQGKIQDIVTCPSVRGKGYGKVVIELLKEQAMIAKCQLVELYCTDKNVEFYRKLGFRTTKKIHTLYK